MSHRPLDTSRKITGAFIVVMAVLFNGRFLWQKSKQNIILLSLSQILQSNSVSQYSSLERRLDSSIAYSDSATMSRGLGFLLAAEGRENDFDKFWLERNLPEAELLHWGKMAQSNQQYDIALAWYTRGLRANQNWGDPWYFTGIVYEDKTQYEEALAAYKQASNAKEFTQIGLADVYTKIGRFYDAAGNLQLATANYDKALKANDFTGIFAKILSLNGVSSGLIRAGNYESAIVLLTEAVKLYPDYNWSYIRLGRAYLECCANYTLAIQNIEEALRLSPNNKWALLTAGDIYSANGQTSLAQQMYEKALVLDPNWEAAQRSLSELNE